MNLKRTSIVLLMFAVLIFAVGFISASDVNDSAIESASSNGGSEILANETQVGPDTQNQAPVSSDNTPKKSVSKIKTKVEADQKAVKYKKSTYYKVKIEDKYDDDKKIANVEIKIKVGTGAKAKTFKVKTNSNGIAKFNTKSLKIGTHKVVITSADEKYEISKKSKIFVGKQYTKTLKSASKKVLKNKDVIKLKIKKEDDEKEVKVVLKKSKFTKIIKAKFYLKNLRTGKIIVKKDDCEFEHGKWDLPDCDFSNRYSLVKVKVYYISTK